MYNFRKVWYVTATILFSDINDRDKVKVFNDSYLNL